MWQIWKASFQVLISLCRKVSNLLCCWWVWGTRHTMITWWLVAFNPHWHFLFDACWLHIFSRLVVRYHGYHVLSGESLKSNLVQTLPMLFYKLSNAFLFTLWTRKPIPPKREKEDLHLQKCQTGRGMFCSLEIRFASSSAFFWREVLFLVDEMGCRGRVAESSIYHIVFSLILSFLILLCFLMQYTTVLLWNICCCFFLFFPQIALAIGVLTSRSSMFFYSFRDAFLASGWVDLCMCWSATVAGCK